MIALGGTNIVKAYLGSTELTNIAIGDELLLSSEPLPYLKFTALEDETFKFGKAIEYSLDGETWTSLAANTASPTIHTGEYIMWRGTYSPENSAKNRFSSTGSFNVEGDPRSIYAGDSFKSASIVNHTFTYLFYQCKVVDASGLLLPATSLANFCYNRMFQGCTSLTAAPRLLPAATLKPFCYQYMFEGCTSITTAPVIAATTLDSTCCRYMFQGCTSLNYIKAMFVTDPSTVFNSLTDWVKNVAASGTFVKNSSATWNITGNNGIPSGWTVETASE